jgi:PAS domain S-box-containing protein
MPVQPSALAVAADEAPLRQELAEAQRRLDAYVRRRQAEGRLRELLWAMRRSEDLDAVVAALATALDDLGLQYTDCGVNWVNAEAAGGATLASRSRAGDWGPPTEPFGAATVRRVWGSRQVAYRADLDRDDPFAERELLARYFGHPVRCVVDVPFAYGTVAVNSERANAFTDEDLEALTGLAAVLGEAIGRQRDLLELEQRTRALEAEAAQREQLQALQRQTEAALRQSLARARAMAAMRDQVLSFVDMAAFDAHLAGPWLTAFRELGVPVYRLSMQGPGTEPGTFTHHWVAGDGEVRRRAGDFPLALCPWLAEAWATGQPVLVDHNRLVASGFAVTEVLWILEVPLPDGSGSIGISSSDPAGFDAAAAPALVEFAGLVALAQRRLSDLERVRDSELRYRAIVQTAADGFELFDAQGRYIDANAATCQTLGYTRDELLSLRVFDVDPTLTPERFTTQLDDMAGVGPVRFETVHRRRNGDLFPVEVTTSVMEVGGARCALALVRDITERKNVEAQLRLFQQAVEGHRDSAIWTDVQNCLVYVNRAACESLGYARDELIGLPLSAIDPQATPAAMDAVWQQLRRDGGLRIESSHRRRDGSSLPVEVVSTHIVIGGIEYNCGFVRDTTERDRLQRELEQQRLRAFHADRLQALGEMAAGVAHELNQPLNGIRAFAEGALYGYRQGWETTPADTAETFTEVVRLVDRMTDVIDHMREFSRAGSDSDPVAFALHSSVDGALKLLGAQLRLHGISVDLDVSAALPRAHGHPNQIEQVVINLITNARDALCDRQRQPATAPPWRPSLRVHATADSSTPTVRLAVADNGGGMPDEALIRAFEPFFTTKEVGKGTGLGLSIARAIVERHHGAISLHNRPGDGLTVVVDLPIARRVGGAEAVVA